MHNNNIGTGVHYLSIPEHPYYKNKYDWNVIDYPHAMDIGRNTVSLPLSPNLSDVDIDRITKAVNKILIKQ